MGNAQHNFVITTVHRDDLDAIGYDMSDVDDDTMRGLAEDMGNAYCEDGFWIDLPIIADNYEIPKQKEETDLPSFNYD